MTQQDEIRTVTVEAPKEPGFYRYDGGNQNMIFLLNAEGQWHAIFDNVSLNECEWGFIEQALSVFNLVKIRPQQLHDPQVAMSLPVFLPGNNRNWEEVQGRAIINNDGQIIVDIQNPDHAGELVEMAKKELLFQIAIDYRTPVDTQTKINNQFTMDVPADEGKVRETMADAMANSGYSDDDETIKAILDALQDAGIKFFEEK